MAPPHAHTDTRRTDQTWNATDISRDGQPITLRVTPAVLTLAASALAAALTLAGWLYRTHDNVERMMAQHARFAQIVDSLQWRVLRHDWQIQQLERTARAPGAGP